jgi:hypothetical protein
MLRVVRFRSTDPVDGNVVIRWKKGLPDRRDEPWFLFTDLSKASAIAVSELYGKRMGIEEFFRDSKSVRNGFALRHTQLTRADRFDRFLPILVLAYWLLTGLGLRTMGSKRPGDWSSCNRGTPCSAAFVGRVMLGRIAVSPTAALAALLAVTIAAAQNWG